MRRALAVVALAALVVLAGCSNLPFVGHPEEPPGGDTIGYENGYWYDDPVDVTTEDGLNESELEAVTARQMARIERIRDREFRSTVPVEVISRAEYRNRSESGGSAGPSGDPWNDQVWESLLLVGESTGSSEAISDTRSSAVLGYYSPGRDQIVIVSETETPVVSRTTLAHELVHALQDQQFGLNRTAETQDTQLATNGVVEGEANYIQQLYQQRCNSGWDCISTPDSDGSGGGGGSSGRNAGVFTVILQPYVSGPGFINTVYGQGGWDAVDALHSDMPASSEQVIHPQRYPDEGPVDVTVPDRSNAEWDRFDHDPVGDTVGEASIFATMYHNGQTDADRYSYESTPSEGWAGDTVVPYHNESGAGGYVWESRWDSETDAREFAEAYRSALTEEHDATRDGNVYVVPEGPFADAFRITRSGDTVRIVNGPTVGDLSEIHEAG